MVKDRIEARISVALQLSTHGWDKRSELVLARQRKSGLWGLFAGGIIGMEDLFTAVRREFKEESGMELDEVAHVDWKTFSIAIVLGEARTKVGFIYPAELLGSVLKAECNVVSPEVDKIRPFSDSELRDLIDQRKIYKPEFNLVGITEWLIDLRDTGALQSSAGTYGMEDDDRNSYREGLGVKYREIGNRTFVVNQ